MRATAIIAFRENREKHSEELLRAFHGQWVAFSSDGSQIIAGAESIAALADKLPVCGVRLDDVVLEQIEFEEDEINLGGAEFVLLSPCNHCSSSTPSA